MKKKIIIPAVTLFLIFCLASIVSANHNESEVKEGAAVGHNAENLRIRLVFNNEEVFVRMYDNPSSRDFLSLLPLTLNFEDYAGTEKISYLPRKLSTQNAPSGSDPRAGDFTYYSPWGNLAIFYKNFRHSPGLVILGKIESGTEKLAAMHGDFTIKIEKAE